MVRLDIGYLIRSRWIENQVGGVCEWADLVSIKIHGNIWITWILCNGPAAHPPP